MNALGACIVATVVSVVLVAPKRWALLGVAAGVLYTTQGLQVEVSGFNLYAIRLVEIAAFVRVVTRRELAIRTLNRLDGAVVGLYVYTVVVFLLRSNEDQVYQIGTGVDALLSYFAFRGLVRDDGELRWFLCGFAVMLVPYAAIVTYETVTTRNPFGAIGGVELIRAGDRWFRGGRMRATGSFGHPSLMGTLGGTFLPIYVGLWLHGRHRVAACIGVLTCIVTVWASNSGGPATCVVVTIVGWTLWAMRREMQWIRRGTVAALVVLSLAMKAPVWYLLARLSNVTGGDGYHRSALLDVAFKNWREWWLAGMRLMDTSTWLPYTNTNTGAVDMTNNFLVFGITAGSGAMVLLVAVLVIGFRFVGVTMATVRHRGRWDLEYLLWALGVSVGVHLFNWFGITYWDQSNVLWLMHLAFVAGVADPASRVDRNSACSDLRSPTMVVPRKARVVATF